MIIVLTFIFSSIATLVTWGMFQFTIFKRVQMLELFLVHRGLAINQEVDNLIKKPIFSDESEKCLSNLMLKGNGDVTMLLEEITKGLSFMNMIKTREIHNWGYFCFG